MRRKMIWTVAWVIVITLIAAGIMLPAASDRTEATNEQERLAEGLDPAAMDLGNADAGGMMALINRSVSLHDR